MTSFFQTTHCVSEAHCDKCRSRAGGRKWRNSLAKICAIPEPDFACPQGKPWGYQPPSRGLGDTVAKVIKTVSGGKIKPCGGCKQRQAALNKLVPYAAHDKTK